MITMLKSTFHEGRKLAGEVYTLPPSLEKRWIEQGIAEACPETLAGDGTEGGAQSERIPCPHCEKDYADADNLERHIAAKHPETLAGDGTEE